MKILMRSIMAFFALAFALPALAASNWHTYVAPAFTQLQSAGRTIVVDVHANWCPTCRAQQPTLDALRAEPRLKDAVFVKVNFDTDKNFLRHYRIPRQSTVLVFKGLRETARSVAETRPAQLRAAIFAGL